MLTFRRITRSPKETMGIAKLSLPIIFAVFLVACGEGGSQSVSSAPATVKQICFPTESSEACYFNVSLDFTNASHQEVGRQYALAINQAMPDFEKTIDALIALHVAVLQIASPKVTYADALARAQTMYTNLNGDYKNEIVGMQEVFNYDVDELLDGRLSKNELLVYQFFSEVMRPVSCSASAVTGDASATGNTILGRNWDWMSVARYGIAHIHAMTTYKNGDKSIANFGTLGTLNALSLFNKYKVFGAIVNATSNAPYPSDLSSRRSFFFDLRYAFENYATLDQISNFMKDPLKKYVYNHLIFLANPQAAGVVENQVVNRPMGAPGNRSFRTWQSTLNPNLPIDQTWGLLNIFATVNDFRLPNNDWGFPSLPPPNNVDTSNTTRWAAFKNLYGNVYSGQKVDVDTLKAITGYPGPYSDGRIDNGAIFNSERQELGGISGPLLSLDADLHVADTTMQSIIVDMNTMNVWVHFVPKMYIGDQPPLRPTYHQITNPLYQQ